MRARASVLICPNLKKVVSFLFGCSGRGVSPAEDDDRAAGTAASTVRLRFCALAIANLKLRSALVVFSRGGSFQPPPQIKGRNCCSLRVCRSRTNSHGLYARGRGRGSCDRFGFLF